MYIYTHTHTHTHTIVTNGLKFSGSTQLISRTLMKINLKESYYYVIHNSKFYDVVDLPVNINHFLHSYKFINSFLFRIYSYLNV